ncbi:MAG: YdcF family protein [Coriobacteriia bacterium]|nr:YdcF family protein [Coriobacteriia bacterium]
MSGKRLAQYLFILIGVVLLTDALIMSLVGNMNLGIVALTLLSLLLIVYGILWRKKRAPIWLHVAVIACCVVVVAFSGFLGAYGASTAARYNEDAVIVLGAGVRGERISSPLAARLDVAVAYFHRNPHALLVVSGGQGPQEDIPEALAMQRYLVARGIPADHIIEEEKSTSTYENFQFSDALLKQRFPEGYSAVFITNSYHVYRAEKTARAAGVAARGLGAPLLWYVVPSAYLREMMAVTSMWVFGVR